MAEALQTLQAYIEWIWFNFSLTSIVDILLVAAIFYGALYLIRGTQAVQLLRGILLLVLGVVILTSVFHLTAFNWLIRNSISALLVAIPVIFQPELRRALERLGRAGQFLGRVNAEPSLTQTIEHLTRAAEELSERRHGALIVLEGDTQLDHIAATGMILDSALSADLLLTIFYPNTDLHDGAVIVRGDRIYAARCVLPLAETPITEGRLGTRHLAAIGVTEHSDALTIVVSEETGVISIARNGRIIRNLDKGRLSRILYRWAHPRERRRFREWLRRSERASDSEEPTSEATAPLLAESE